jgi:hypothetical protein
MWHRAMPSNTKPNTNLIIRHSLLLVKKYFLIIAAYFGPYTKATIRLNCSKIKMHNRDTRLNSIVRSHVLKKLIPPAFSYFWLLVILSPILTLEDFSTDQLHLEDWGKGNMPNPPFLTWWWWCFSGPHFNWLEVQGNLKLLI